jgi:hypothetical protein
MLRHYKEHRPMRPPANNLTRFFLCSMAALFITLAGTSGILRAQQKSAPAQEKPKIRAITAFINLDRAQYKEQVADTLKMLRRARTVFESRGYQVQTIRIATQPFPEYTKGLTTEQAVAFLKQYDALAATEKFAASIGPAMVNAGDSDSQANLLAEILSNTKTLNASLVVASEDGVNWKAVGAAARVMKKLEETEHSQGNFHFAAIAMVPPLTPFFPAAYHTGFGRQFAIALESANVVAAAFKDAPDLAAAKQRLTDSLAASAFDIERHVYGDRSFAGDGGKCFDWRGHRESDDAPRGHEWNADGGSDDYRGGQRRQSEANRIYRLDASHPGRFAAGAALERRAHFD